MQTGSGQTYLGVVPTYLTARLEQVTGAFYCQRSALLHAGREDDPLLAMVQPGQRHHRAFEFAQNNALPNNVTGMFMSGSTLYYASGLTGGALHLAQLHRRVGGSG